MEDVRSATVAAMHFRAWMHSESATSAIKIYQKRSWRLRYPTRWLVVHIAANSHEEAGSEDLCFLTDTTPKEVIDHLKNCGVAIEEGPVNKQGAIGSLKSVYCRDPDGSLIEISAYED